MTAALKQAHIALTAIATHPTLELSDFMREKLAAAITAAEAELSREQPARVGLTLEQINRCREWFDAVMDTNPGYLDQLDYRLAVILYAQLKMRASNALIERAHNIPAAQEGK